MKTFSGQYIAVYSRNDGATVFLTVNVDPDKEGKGVAYIANPNERSQSRIYECVVYQNGEGYLEGTAFRSPRLESVHGLHFEYQPEDLAEFTFQINNGEANDSLLSVVTAKGRRSFPIQMIDGEQRVIPIRVSSWSDFKDWAVSCKRDDPNALFRGMTCSSFRPITSFHRTGRTDLERYRDADFEVFTDLAETVAGLRFDQNAHDLGASWGFAQHHGFPTPLLDWTESPYIAAYFSFYERVAQKGQRFETDTVRVYCLAGGFVSNNRPPVVNMSDVFPRVWVFRPRSKGNHRLVFQQGAFIHSTVVSIEAYLLYWAKKCGFPTISAIEMPASLAAQAVEELGYMGINHLSLFPGLDGAAKYAAFKQFFTKSNS